jgi:hypothetical protein
MADFAAPDLIQLPRLSGQEAATLIGEMLVLARSKQESLPGPIDRSAQRLRAAHATLESTLRGGDGKPGDSLPAPIARRRADRALDAAWEATFEWLSGWCKLAAEANPHREATLDLVELIFADTRATGTLPYKVELAESRIHLAAIAREAHDATFLALGGAPFLTHLRAAHEALEIIVSHEAVIDCRVELASAAAALRQYVVRLSSHADSENSGSEALSTALMAPLDRWQKIHPTRPAEDIYGVAEETRF